MIVKSTLTKKEYDDFDNLVKYAKIGSKESADRIERISPNQLKIYVSNNLLLCKIFKTNSIIFLKNCTIQTVQKGKSSEIYLTPCT